MSTNVSTESNSTFANAKKVILALQHLIAMFGATVLVPILTGLNPAVALLSAGCGTLIFHFTTKKKVPVFLGSSFAFIPGIIAVGEQYGLQYAQGGIMVAGLLYVILSFVIAAVGSDSLQKLLPSHVVGPMIIVIGLNLVPVAFGMASGNWMLAAITLGVALIMNFFAKGFAKQLAILVGVLVGYLVATAMGAVDFTAIKEASLIAMPAITTPKFDAGAIMMIAPVVLAVFMEHIGDITTNGAVVGKDFVKDPGLNRTLLGDGLATLFAGMIGGPANTTYGENTGVLAITKNYDPSILRLAAVFAIGLATIGKIGAALTTIPVPVMGGISLMLFSMIALIGVQTIKNNNVKFNAKNLIVMATILFIGLAGSYLKMNIAITVPFINTSLSGLSLAALAGVLLNAVLSAFIKE